VYRILRTGAIAVHNLLNISLPLPAEAPLSITVDSDESNSSLEVRRDIAGVLDEEVGQPSACDWLEPPPISEALAVEESQRQKGDAGVMLEAFQQFQQNPQVQVRTAKRISMSTCTQLKRYL